MTWRALGNGDGECGPPRLRGLSTYFGTYAVDTQARTVTHTVEGAMTPDWIGMKLVRRYRFVTPDTIELSVVPDAQLPTTGLVLVWRRVQ